MTHPARPEPRPEYRFGPFRYDCGQRLLFRGSDTVPLAPKVGETLRVLLEHHGSVVDKAELMRAVWPDTSVEEIGLARNISQLRKALGDDGETGLYIETLPKRGYRFVGEIAPDETEGASEVAGAAEAGVATDASDPQVSTQLRRLRTTLLALAGVCVILAVVYWQFYRPSRYLSTGSDIASVAVIPFECLSPELDCAAFPHGLDDLLVARLSGLSSVHVLSPSTVRTYQRARLSMPFMARLLGMDVMLDGTVQRADDRVRITARLIDVHSAKLIWSDSYEYPLQQAADAQSLAAHQIAAQVDAHLANRRQLLPAIH